MRKLYARPNVTVLGTMVTLTQGVSGTLPDNDVNNVNINDDCIQQELGGGLKTSFCVVGGGSN